MPPQPLIVFMPPNLGRYDLQLVAALQAVVGI